MAQFDPKDWPEISALLDEAIELPAERRRHWLDELNDGARAHRDVLEQLLADHARVETLDFLHTLPKVGLSDAGDATALGDVSGTVGPYRLLHELGRGGMGSVWLAERADGSFRRLVALKLPRLTWGTGLAERMARERDIGALLEHPHIARLYDAGVDAFGRPYLALEYIDGQPLDVWCTSNALNVPERLRLFMQVTRAVAYAHGRLVVHRDLKPSNVLVTADGQAHLLDFGIAKLLLEATPDDQLLTQEHGRMLTPHYASPEQLRGEVVTVASDVYSLGVLLYQLLTGRLPYAPERKSLAALEEAVLQGEAEPASGRAEHKATAKALRGELDAILAKALRREPGQRYATADALAEDIERHLNGEPVLAQPDSTTYRVRKFLGRHRLAAASGATIFLALGVGFGVALWQASVAREQARLARNEAATSEAVQVFMADIFKANTVRQPDPAKAQLTTARELLDAGTQKIDTALHGAPAAKYRVLRTLMQMYDSLDLPTTATDLGRQRVAVARSAYGAVSPELAEALVDLGDVANNADTAEDAGKALREAEQILDAARDFSSFTRGRMEIQFANHMLWKSALGPARDHVDRGIHVLRNQPPSHDLLFGLWCKAKIELDAHDMKTAEAASLEALRVAASLKEQANDLLPAINDISGLAQMGLEELRAAEVSLRASLEAARHYYGDDHLETVEALRVLGKFLIGTSRLDEGLRVLEPARSAAIVIGATSQDSTSPAHMLETVAGGLNQFGRIEEGLEALRAATAMRSGREPVAWLDPPLAEQTAFGLTETGHYGEATELLNKIAVALHHDGASLAALSNDFLAVRTRLLLVQGHADEAAESFAAFQVVALDSGVVSRTGLEKRVTEAEIVLAQGDAEGAVEKAAEVRGLVTGNANRPYLGIWEARAALVEGSALCRLNRAAEALPLLQHANELSSTLFDPQRSPFLAAVKVALANCLLDLGRTGPARSEADGARRIHATHPDLGEHYRRPLRELQARLRRSVLRASGALSPRLRGSRLSQLGVALSAARSAPANEGRRCQHS